MYKYIIIHIYVYYISVHRKNSTLGQSWWYHDRPSVFAIYVLWPGIHPATEPPCGKCTRRTSSSCELWRDQAKKAPKKDSWQKTTRPKNISKPLKSSILNPEKFEILRFWTQSHGVRWCFRFDFLGWKISGALPRWISWGSERSDQLPRYYIPYIPIGGPIG